MTACTADSTSCHRRSATRETFTSWRAWITRIALSATTIAMRTSPRRASRSASANSADGSARWVEDRRDPKSSWPATCRTEIRDRDGERQPGGDQQAGDGAEPGARPGREQHRHRRPDHLGGLEPDLAAGHDPTAGEARDVPPEHRVDRPRGDAGPEPDAERDHDRAEAADREHADARDDPGDEERQHEHAVLGEDVMQPRRHEGGGEAADAAGDDAGDEDPLVLTATFRARRRGGT